MSNERPGVEKVGRQGWDFLEEKFKLLRDKDEKRKRDDDDGNRGNLKKVRYYPDTKK